MIGLFARLALVLALLGNVAASAQYLGLAPSVTARWVTSRLDPAEQSLNIKEGDSVPFSALVPKRNLVSKDPFLDPSGKILIPAGTRFVDADIVRGKNYGMPMACAIERMKGMESHLCLADKDRDGKFESFMKLYGVNDLFFESIANPSPKPGMAGIALTVDSAPSPVVAEVKLFFENRAELAKVNVFYFCVFSQNQNMLGIKHAEPRCSPDEIAIKDGNYPVRTGYLGGGVEFISREANIVSARILRPPAGIEAW